MTASAYAPYAHLPLVLSGGVFQNRILIDRMLDRFPEAILPEQIPPNDGGIALGQIAAMMTKV
jgi:hydrogenase maturation protein HypF